MKDNTPPMDGDDPIVPSSDPPRGAFEPPEKSLGLADLSQGLRELNLLQTLALFFIGLCGWPLLIRSGAVCKKRGEAQDHGTSSHTIRLQHFGRTSL